MLLQRARSAMIFLLVKNVLKPVTCMAFGYTLLLMAMSEVLPMTTPLTLTIAFFVPLMDKRSFLTLMLIWSAYTTLMTSIYRDAIRVAFLGLDVIDLMAIAVLAPIYILAGNLEAILQIPDALLLATGIASLFTSYFVTATVENWIIMLLLRKVGFYRRIGKTCPKEWSIWRG